MNMNKILIDVYKRYSDEELDTHIRACLFYLIDALEEKDRRLMNERRDFIRMLKDMKNVEGINVSELLKLLEDISGED